MNMSKIFNHAIANGTEVVFTYGSTASSPAGVRHVQPTEIINGDVVVAIDLDKNGYRRFSMNCMSDVREVS